MTWRLARSLEKLRSQVNSAWPKRSKVSDGTIGDARHSAQKSDHNPDPGGVVRALDITHDPVEGPDSEKLANALLASRDPRIKYIISNKKIVSGAGGTKPWVWRPYDGANAHSRHVHISVVPGPAGDDTADWKIGAPGVATDPAPAKPAPPINRPLLVFGAKNSKAVEDLQRLLNAHGRALVVDGDFGPKTLAAVKAFQEQHGLYVDGSVGIRTWAALG
jgi:hypothetical protein